MVDATHAWARLDPPFPISGVLRGSGLAFTSDGGQHWTYAGVPRIPA